MDLDWIDDPKNRIEQYPATLPPACVTVTATTCVKVSSIENQEVFENLNRQRGDLEIATSVRRINFDRAQDIWTVQSTSPQPIVITKVTKRYADIYKK